MALRKESVLGRIEVITGVERRRRYSDAEHGAIRAECDKPGATTTGVARRLGISLSLIHNWRRMRREAEKIASEPLQFTSYGIVPEAAGGAVAPTPAASSPPPLAPTHAEELVRPYPGARPFVSVQLYASIGSVSARVITRASTSAM